MTENITYLHTQVVTRVHSRRMRTHRLQSRGSLYSEVQFDKVGGGMASVQLGTMSGKGQSLGASLCSEFPCCVGESLYGEVQCITGNGRMDPSPSPEQNEGHD